MHHRVLCGKLPKPQARDEQIQIRAWKEQKNPTARCGMLPSGVLGIREGVTPEIQQYQCCWLLHGGLFAAGCWDLAERVLCEQHSRDNQNAA